MAETIDSLTKKQAYLREYQSRPEVAARRAANSKTWRSKRREITKAYQKEYRRRKKAGLPLPVVKVDRPRISAQEMRERRRAKDRSPEVRAKKREYVKRRAETDPVYKLKRLLRGRIIGTIKRASPRGRSIALLGCTVVEYRAYLESLFKPGMTWDNHGPKGWHIDHIRPCASFDLTKSEEQRACFHYSNTQPLWWVSNLQKNDRVIPEKPRQLPLLALLTH